MIQGQHKLRAFIILHPTSANPPPDRRPTRQPNGSHFPTRNNSLTLTLVHFYV